MTQIRLYYARKLDWVGGQGNGLEDIDEMTAEKEVVHISADSVGVL